MERVVGPPWISGRVSERASLIDLVRNATEGRPGAVLLHGEAGVGKTALVRSVAQEVSGDGVQVLWGSGLRFDAADALYLPVTMALDRWLRDAAPEARERVLIGVPGVGAVLPSLGDRDGSAAASRPAVVVDALLSRILELGPVMFVLDDVHWADPASLGVLAYLIAGMSQQRLALVTTYRDEDSHHADEFRTWIADMRRLPSVDVLTLERLDKVATRLQVARLIGSDPGDDLLDQVFQRSQGNAYLTELLVSETGAQSEELSEPLPEVLLDALLSAWQRLTPPARTLTQILAVAGRPAELPVLREVVLALEGEEPSAAAWHEAVDAGIVLRDRETVWFRHPLLADVLMGEFLPGEASPVHAAWAQALSGISTAGIDEVRRQSSLALHCEAAGDAAGAFAASLAAADLAEDQLSLGDAARNLVRSARLWDSGAPEPDDTSARLALLERAVLMCNRADQGPDGHALVVEALTLIDESAEPLRASRLLQELADLEWELGQRVDPPVETITRALELARPWPDSLEYAEALTMLSNVFRWLGRHEEAVRRVEEALPAARRSGSPRAMSRAMTALAFSRADLRLADAESQQALTLAQESGDDVIIGNAYGARALLLIRMGHQRELTQMMPLALAHALRHNRGTAESALFVGVLVFLGDLPAAYRVLREGLPLAGKASWTARLRLHGAVLASRRGDARTARMHRTRAYELMPALERRLNAFNAPWIAEIMLANSEPSAALRLALDTMAAARGSAPTSLDELLMWGARAAADLVEAGDDARDPDAVSSTRERLAALISSRNAEPGVPFEASCETDLVHPAMGALFEAERRRATGEGDRPEAWRHAALMCERAGMRWDQHQALWRLGAELVKDGAVGTEAGDSLRAAHRYAVEAGAGPLLDGVNEVAGLGRITLTEAVAPIPRETRPAAFAELTEREAEVLSHLVANRTNAEIASRLFISGKTVSVHVSNVLRKTSTTSRREVAALATRLGWGSAD